MNTALVLLLSLAVGQTEAVAVDAERPFSAAAKLGPDDRTEEGRLSKLYFLALEQGRTYRFELISKEFEPHLRLLDARGSYLASGEGQFSFAAPETGRYRLQATTLSKGAKGDFSLRIAVSKPAAETILELEPEPGDAGKKLHVTEQKFDSGVTAQTFLFTPGRRFRGDVLWSADGKTITILDDHGTLRRINLETWEVERRADLKEKCNNLSESRQGLLVSALTQYGSYIRLDPASFEVRKKLDAPSMVRIASHPDLDHAVIAIHPKAFQAKADDAFDDREGRLWVVSLTDPKKLPYQMPTTAVRDLRVFRQEGLPRGSPQHVVQFKNGPSDSIARYALEAGVLRGYDTIGEGTLTPDGRYLWRMPSNKESIYVLDRFAPRPMAGGVAFYKREPLRAPALAFYLSAGEGCRIAAYNPTTGDVYVHNRDHQFIAHGTGSVRLCELSLAVKGADNTPREFLVSPDGKKVLIRFDNRLALVDVSPLQKRKPAFPLEGATAHRVLFSKAGIFEHNGFASTLDRLSDSRGTGKVYYVPMEKGRSYTARSDAAENYPAHLELYRPNGELAVSRPRPERFGGYHCTLEHKADESGVFALILRSTERNTAGSYRIEIVQTGGAVQPLDLLPLPPPPAPIAVEEKLRTAPLETGRGVKATTIALPALPDAGVFIEHVCRTKDGKWVYLVDDSGALLQIDAASWTVKRKLPTPKQIASLHMSSTGLVARIGFTEIWVIDPETLAVRKQIEARDVRHISCVPDSPIALLNLLEGRLNRSLLYGDNEDIQVLNLAKGAYIERTEPLKALYRYQIALSPSGKQAVSYGAYPGGAALLSYDLVEGKLAVTGVQSAPGGILQKIGLSSGGNYFYAHTDGAYERREAMPGPFSIPIYALGQPRNTLPALRLTLDAPCCAFAIDERKKLLLATGPEQGLMLFDWSGKQHYESLLGPRIGGSKYIVHNDVLEFVLHPEGGKALARFTDRLVHIDYSALPDGQTAAPDGPSKETPAVKATRVWAHSAMPDQNLHVRIRRLEMPDPGFCDFCWDTEGKCLFHAGKRGTLHRIRFPDIRDEAQNDLPRAVRQLVWTKAGIAALTMSPSEVYLIDPQTLKVEATIPLAGMTAIAGSPASTKLVAVGATLPAKGFTALIDLKAKKVMAEEMEGRPEKVRHFRNPCLTPDGKKLFLYSDEGGMHRVRIEEAKLVYEESRDSLNRGSLRAFAVSPDGKTVVCYAENTHLERRQQTLRAFSTENWDKPVLTLPDNYRRFAFLGAGHFVGQKPSVSGGADRLHLGPVPPGTAKPDELIWDHSFVLQLLPHPNGRGFLLTSESWDREKPMRVYYAELPPAK